MRALFRILGWFFTLRASLRAEELAPAIRQKVGTTAP